MTAAAAAARFRDAFGRAPAVVASAPGRANLLGEHTDYNGGDVLPIAIALRTWVAAARSPGGTSRAVSSGHRAPARFNARRFERRGQWEDYLAAGLAVLSRRGVLVPEMDFAVAGEVPAGAGLSSSAALETATLLAAITLTGTSITPDQLARDAHQSEHDFVGVPCGIMDQFASAMGRAGQALYIRCDEERVEPVPFTGAVLVFDTRSPRALRQSAYAERRAECDVILARLQDRHPGLHWLARATKEMIAEARLSETLSRRATHVVEETDRVRRAVTALRNGRTLPGALLYASHASLRDLYECSSPELDWFVERTVGAAGIDGARMTGAGWGGCAIATGDLDALRRFAADTVTGYRARFGREARWWVTTAAGGASVEVGGAGA